MEAYRVSDYAKINKKIEDKVHVTSATALFRAAQRNRQTRRPVRRHGENQASRPRPARPLGRPDPPRVPPNSINTALPRASPHSSLAPHSERTYALATQPTPVLVFSVTHNESDNGSVRDRRFSSGDCVWPRAETPRGRERGDPDVFIKAPGFGAVYAEEQEDFEIGGDPARDRLHLRPAVCVGEPPCYGPVRRRGSPGDSGRGALPAPTAGAARAAQHHPPVLAFRTRTQKPNDTRKAEPVGQAVVLNV